MQYTQHAIQRFNQRYPQLKLEEEAGTFTPATKKVMKLVAKTAPKGYATPASNIVKGGGRIYVSSKGALAVVMEAKSPVVVTFMPDPTNIFVESDHYTPSNR